MSKETGGQAFPKTGNYNPDGSSNFDSYDTEGMTLRDYFAAKAMQVLLSKDNLFGYGEVAEHCYLVADRMLEARK